MLIQQSWLNESILLFQKYLLGKYGISFWASMMAFIFRCVRNDQRMRIKQQKSLCKMWNVRDGTLFCRFCLFYFDIDCTKLMCSVPCAPYMPCTKLNIAGATVSHCIYAFVRILQCKRVGGFTLFSNASENKVKVISHTPHTRLPISNSKCIFFLFSSMLFFVRVFSLHSSFNWKKSLFFEFVSRITFDLHTFRYMYNAQF